MMKVRVTGAYVDGHGPGSTLSVNEKTADYLVKNGYGEIVEEPKVEKAKEEPKDEPKSKRRKSKKKGD